MELKEGVSLRTLTREPITKAQLAHYAEASGDNNKIHLDDEFAKQAGFPSVIAHGMLSMAILADHLRYNFPESEFDLQRLKTRFRKVTFPGDVLECRGTIKKVLSDRDLIVTLWIKNQNDETTTDGEAQLRRR